MSKAQLQRRMEDARESISQTVDEIKDTVSEQYETVKETVTDVLDWKEQFQKNPLVWGLGAVAVGIGVGVCDALEIVGAYTSPGYEKVRLWAALSAVVCAVAMLARALVLTVKLRQQI